MPLRAHLVALVFAVFCGDALAADVIGYGESFDTLYRIDLSTRDAQELGRAGFLNGQQLIAYNEGLSLSPSGDLYAASDGIKSLIRINPTNGAATVVGPLNLAGENPSQLLDLGMTFTCDGRLWLSAGDGNFWQVDPATGATTIIGKTGVKITGLTANGNRIYAAGSQGNNNLYLVDPDTAQVTLVGSYGAGTSYITTTSPGFDANGQLWAILNYVPPPQGTTVAEWSDLARLDATSGTLTDSGNIVGPVDLQFIGLKGLAITPPTCAAARPGDAAPAVSLPGLMFMFALIVLIAGTRLRRQRPNV